MSGEWGWRCYSLQLPRRCGARGNGESSCCRRDTAQWSEDGRSHHRLSQTAQTLFPWRSVALHTKYTIGSLRLLTHYFPDGQPHTKYTNGSLRLLTHYFPDGQPHTKYTIGSLRLLTHYFPDGQPPYTQNTRCHWEMRNEQRDKYRPIENQQLVEFISRNEKMLRFYYIRYTIETARSDFQDCIDGQRVIELCNQRTENTLLNLT